MPPPNRTEYALLGLLSLGARTGYDIKRMADDALSHFWHESFGHIYPILKRLETKRLWVTSTIEPQANRPDRKVYALTPEGEAALQAWFEAPIEPVPPRNELLLKLFFAPLASPAALAAQIEAYQAHQAAALERLDALEAQATAEEAYNPALTPWRLTVEHERVMLDAALAWCDGALDRLSLLAADSALR